MFGSSSRKEQRKDPSWTQAPLGRGQSEPVWRDAGSGTPPAYEPTQQQALAPRKSSPGKFWVSVILAIVGLLAVAYLLLSMFNVVEEQMARNQSQAEPIPAGMTRVSSPPGR